MHKKFELNRTKIKCSCQSGRKVIRGRPFRISEFLGGEGVKEIRIFSDMGGRGGQENSDIRIF